VTISLTLGIHDNSYLLESSSWSTSNVGIQSGTIENLSSATVDNFRWVWNSVSDGTNNTTDFVELDQIVIQTVPEPQAFSLLASILALGAVALRRRSV
jgi:hypothetical protein